MTDPTGTVPSLSHHDAAIRALAKRRKVRMSVSIPGDLARFARDEAARLGVSISLYVEYAVIQHRATFSERGER